MEKNKIMEDLNEVVTDSKKGFVVKLVVCALGVASGIASLLIYKKKKNEKKSEINDNDQNN